MFGFIRNNLFDASYLRPSVDHGIIDRSHILGARINSCVAGSFVDQTEQWLVQPPKTCFIADMGPGCFLETCSTVIFLLVKEMVESMACRLLDRVMVENSNAGWYMAGSPTVGLNDQQQCLYSWNTAIAMTYDQLPGTTAIRNIAASAAHFHKFANGCSVTWECFSYSSQSFPERPEPYCCRARKHRPCQKQIVWHISFLRARRVAFTANIVDG